MSKSLNKVQLIGHLGADPQMRYTQSGVAVTSFSLATNRSWTDKEGNLREETEWHSIVAWDRLAQICSEHLAKGRLVYIEGRLQTRSWEHEGQTRYRTEIVALDMLILDSRGTAVEEPAPQSASAPSQQRSTSEPAPRRTASRSADPTPLSSARASRAAVIDDDNQEPDDLPF